MFLCFYKQRSQSLRERVSRIFFNRRFFDYPVSLSPSTVRNLGLFETFRIGLSYLKTKVTPAREELSLEDTVVRLRKFGPDYVGYTITTYLFFQTMAWVKAMSPSASTAGAVAPAVMACLYRKWGITVSPKVLRI